MNARKTDPETSHKAASAFAKKAGKVDDRIRELARAAGTRGIAQSNAVDAVPEYRPGSITPRFARLVRRGKLVRVYIGIGKPTKRFPKGRPIHKTRVDEVTNQKVLVNWLPEFAPAPNEKRDPADGDTSGGVDCDAARPESDSLEDVNV